MGLSLSTQNYYDNGGGVNLITSPTKVPEDESSSSLNIDYSTDGAVLTRYGSTIQNVSAGIPAQMSGAPRTLLLYDFKKEDGSETQIVCAGTTIKHGLTTPTNQVTGLSAALPVPDIEKFTTSDDEYAIWGNGVDSNLKFNGTSWTNLSIARPAAPTPADNGAGTLPAGDYSYYYSFARTVGGVIVQESELSPVGTVTIAANRQIRVTIAASADSQVNARVIYRISTTSAGVAYRLTTIADNVTLTYDDNTAADGTVEAEFDNQATPVTRIIEECFGILFTRDEDKKTDMLYSKAYRPWHTPTANRIIFDAEITCFKRFYGGLLIGTKNSIWFQQLPPETIEPRRISSKIGIWNNRCAVGESTLYILATNRKFYAINPTDLTQSEIRVDSSLSFKVESQFKNISWSNAEKACMEFYSVANTAKVMLAAPVTTSNNDKVFVYNETQSSLKGKPVWQIVDNWSPSALRQMVVSGAEGLYSGDYNGFLWLLDDPTKFGDGAEENGTATAGNTTTLTDGSKAWTVNAFAGMMVNFISGTGADQSAVIASNTGTVLTFTAAVTTAPASGTGYTIGGYDTYHFTNWKSILGSYDALKQLWYILLNLNASGSYTIDLILQFDFDTSLTNQITLGLQLSSENAIWNAFNWLAGVWGSRSVFQERIRYFARFKAMRVGFRHRKAGQPFQVNGFGLSVQDKGLFFTKAA